VIVALVSWVSFGVSFATGSVTWRLPLALSGLWSLIVLIIIYQLPESPRWLVREGRIDEAREVLAALDDVTADSEQINKDIVEIQESLAATGNGKFLDIFTNGKERLFHRTCLAAAGQLFQQLCGINTIAFYVSTIFQQDLGLSAIVSRVLGAAVFTWQTLASPIGVLTVDRVGRRKLMLVSCVGMGVCMAILAGTVSQSHNRAAVIVAGISIFIFSGFFPVG
jgi:MFS family permease